MASSPPRRDGGHMQHGAPSSALSSPSRPQSVGWSVPSPGDETRSVAASHMTADSEALLAQQAQLMQQMQADQRHFMESHSQRMQHSFMTALQVQMHSQMAQQAQIMQHVAAMSSMSAQAAVAASQPQPPAASTSTRGRSISRPSSRGRSSSRTKDELSMTAGAGLRLGARPGAATKRSKSFAGKGGSRTRKSRNRRTIERESLSPTAAATDSHSVRQLGARAMPPASLSQSGPLPHHMTTPASMHPAASVPMSPYPQVWPGTHMAMQPGYRGGGIPAYTYAAQAQSPDIASYQNMQQQSGPARAPPGSHRERDRVPMRSSSRASSRSSAGEHRRQHGVAFAPTTTATTAAAGRVGGVDAAASMPSLPHAHRARGERVSGSIHKHDSKLPGNRAGHGTSSSGAGILPPGTAPAGAFSGSDVLFPPHERTPNLPASASFSTLPHAMPGSSATSVVSATSTRRSNAEEVVDRRRRAREASRSMMAHRQRQLAVRKQQQQQQHGGHHAGSPAQSRGVSSPSPTMQLPFSNASAIGGGDAASASSPTHSPAAALSPAGSPTRRRRTGNVARPDDAASDAVARARAALAQQGVILPSSTLTSPASSRPGSRPGSSRHSTRGGSRPGSSRQGSRGSRRPRSQQDARHGIVDSQTTSSRRDMPPFSSPPSAHPSPIRSPTSIFPQQSQTQYQRALTGTEVESAISSTPSSPLHTHTVPTDTRLGDMDASLASVPETLSPPGEQLSPSREARMTVAVSSPQSSLKYVGKHVTTPAGDRGMNSPSVSSVTPQLPPVGEAEYEGSPGEVSGVAASDVAWDDDRTSISPDRYASSNYKQNPEESEGKAQDDDDAAAYADDAFEEAGEQHAATSSHADADPGKDDNAATRIQAMTRGRRDRERVRHMRESQLAVQTAAAEAKRVRQALEDEAAAAEREAIEAEEAAAVAEAKLEADRKERRRLRAEAKAEAQNEARAQAEAEAAATATAAAVRVQSLVRGHAARAEVTKMRAAARAKAKRLKAEAAREAREAQRLADQEAAVRKAEEEARDAASARLEQARQRAAEAQRRAEEAAALAEYDTDDDGHEEEDTMDKMVKPMLIPPRDDDEWTGPLPLHSAGAGTSPPTGDEGGVGGFDGPSATSSAMLGDTDAAAHSRLPVHAPLRTAAGVGSEESGGDCGEESKRPVSWGSSGAGGLGYRQTGSTRHIGGDRKDAESDVEAVHSGEEADHEDGHAAWGNGAGGHSAGASLLGHWVEDEEEEVAGMNGHHHKREPASGNAVMAAEDDPYADAYDEAYDQDDSQHPDGDMTGEDDDAAVAAALGAEMSVVEALRAETEALLKGAHHQHQSTTRGASSSTLGQNDAMRTSGKRNKKTRRSKSKTKGKASSGVQRGGAPPAVRRAGSSRSHSLSSSRDSSSPPLVAGSAAAAVRSARVDSADAQRRDEASAQYSDYDDDGHNETTHEHAGSAMSQSLLTDHDATDVSPGGWHPTDADRDIALESDDPFAGAAGRGVDATLLGGGDTHPEHAVLHGARRHPEDTMDARMGRGGVPADVWEAEVARGILAIYRTQANAEADAEERRLAKAGKAPRKGTSLRSKQRQLVRGPGRGNASEMELAASSMARHEAPSGLASLKRASASAGGTAPSRGSATGSKTRTRTVSGPAGRTKKRSKAADKGSRSSSRGSAASSTATARGGQKGSARVASPIALGARPGRQSAGRNGISKSAGPKRRPHSRGAVSGKKTGARSARIGVTGSGKQSDASGSDSEPASMQRSGVANLPDLDRGSGVGDGSARSAFESVRSRDGGGAKSPRPVGAAATEAARRGVGSDSRSLPSRSKRIGSGASTSATAAGSRGSTRRSGASGAASSGKGKPRMKNGAVAPIWFGGSGGGSVSARAVWRGLAREGGGFTDDELSEALSGLERDGRYDKYLDVVERLLLPRVRAEDRGPMPAQQWRQAVVAATVFAAKFADEDRWSQSLSTLRRAQEMIAADPFMEIPARRELTGFVLDGFASYYYRRRRLQAALQASRRAGKAHASLSQWEHVAKCHLHTACVLSRMGKHGESARTVGRVLQLMEADKLEGQGTAKGATPQKLCMLSVAYHNAAVEHVAAGQGEDACIASQNARRLAKLCLGLSARYTPALEATHAAALAQLEKGRGVTSSVGHDPRKLKAFRELAAALYT